MQIMYFHNVFVVWGITLFGLPSNICKTYQEYGVYNRNEDEHLFISPEDTVTDAGSLTRPLLADDAFSIHSVTASLDVINASKLFFRTKRELINPIKSNLQKTYNDLIQRKDESTNIQQGADRFQESEGEDNKILDKIWHMYTKGTLGNRQGKYFIGPFESKWIVIRKKVLPGSFLEIGGCDVALSAGRTSKNSTAIAVTFKKENGKHTELSCARPDVHNLYTSLSTPQRLQSYFRDVYTDYKVLFSNIYLTDFTALSEKLLPHEFVEMLAMVFSMGKKIVIPNINLSKSQELYFKEQWVTPGALFDQACTWGSLECDKDVMWSYDGWSNDDVLYSLTIKHGRRYLPRKTCLRLSSHEKCYASYNETSPNMTVVFDNGKHLISPVHANEIHLRTLLNLGLSEETKELLFVRLLELPFQGLQAGDVFVTGSNLIRRKIIDISVHQDTYRNHFIHISKPETFPQNQSAVIIRPKEAKSKSTGKDIGRVNHVGTSWMRQTRGKRHQSQQFGGGWEREDSDRDHHHRELSDETQTMEREADSLDSVDEHFVENSERKELSDEEKQIHRGLDFLQSRMSYPLEDKNTMGAKAVFNNPSTPSVKLGNVGKRSYNLSLIESNDQEIKEHKKRRIRKSSELKFKHKGAPSQSKLPKSIVSGAKHKLKNLLVRPKSSPSVQANQIPDPEVIHQISQNMSLEISTSVKGFKRVHPKDSGKLLKVLFGDNKTGSRGDNKTDLTISDVSPNKRKLLSYPSFSNQSGTVSDTYVHYTRRRRQTLSDDSNQPTKQPEQPFSFSMVTDELLFDGQWCAMKSYIMDVGDLDSDFSIFVYGGKRQSLLGTKVEMLYPKANVITVFPQSYARLVGEHRKLAKPLLHPNNIVFNSDLSGLLVSDLISMPELFKFQVLSLDIFRLMMSLNEMYPYYLGQILTMAETTFLEIPHFSQLTLARAVFSDTQEEHSTQGLITEAVSLVGAEIEVIETLKVVIREELHSLILRIKLKSFHRKVKVGCDSTPGILTLLPDGAVSLNVESTNTFHTVSRSKVGIGLNWLLRMGLQAQDRAFLFQEYLKLPIHSDMCPAHIVWVDHHLKYQPVTVEAEPPIPHTLGGNKEFESSQRTLDLLGKQIEKGSFSFMDYNSKDNTGYELAARHPNSTFVSLLMNSDRVRPLLQSIEEKNITNIVLNVVDIDTKLTSKLLKCPDFLRYQFLDYDEILRQMKLQVHNSFGLLIGQMIGTGVTSFVQIPSSKILSLATVTLYPEDLDLVTKPDITNNSTYLFQEESHPFTYFKDTEEKFLFETANADVDIEIAARVLSPDPLPDGAQLPWKLARVDVQRLKVEVDHHFDYTKDGHQRKYTLHCVSNSTDNYTVYLVRSSDGFKIPYGNVNAISLIALLRMGLENSIRDKFYSEFLKLPLYEDMAPWNIVFRAGHLSYIDYDSKDHTFNKMAGAAYQIMAMLMNYKRTIEDFGRCKSKAKTAYGFDSVAECVGSNYKGPCTDIRYPVPCGDHTCRATYIDCLQALQVMELSKDKIIQQGRHKTKISKSAVESTRYMQWSFDADGPKKKYH